MSVSAWCLSIAPRHVRARSSGPSDRQWWRNSHELTTLVCGDACRTSFSWTCTSVLLKCKMLPLSRCVLVGLGSAAHGVLELPHIDCLPMIHGRHPHVAAELLEQLEGHPDSPCLQKAATTAPSLVGIMGFEPPSWRAVMAGARPPPVQPEEFEPAQRGWQHEAASRVERAHRETQIFPTHD